MRSDWKEALQRYLDAVHQTRLDGNVQRLLTFYTGDATLTEPEQERWRREWEQWRLRGAVPVAVRGKVTPLHSVQWGDRLEAALSWYTRITYRHNEKQYVEENHRLQRVSMRKHGDDWAFLWPWGWYFDCQHMEQIPFAEEAPAADDPIQEVAYEPGYNREQAVAYAERYWNSANPAYPRFTDDCTNFISQCLHAGGIPMVFAKDNSKGWWFRGGKLPNWSYSWTVAHSLYLLLKAGREPMRAVQLESPEQLRLGDVICYDFDGDGRWQHNTMVVAKDANQMPLVNAHTTNSRMRYWEYRDSTAYTPKVRYAFFHIRGV
jgi:hypothetical protein